MRHVIAVASLVMWACGESPAPPDPEWTRLSPNVAGDLSQLAGTATEVWALGTTDINGRANVIARWDGTTWTELPPETGFNSIAAAGGTDIWLAGMSGKLARWDGTALAPIASGVTARLGPLWGASGDDVWVVQAASPSLLHWDGSTLGTVAVGAAPITSVSGTARDDVWAVGGSVLYHYDGASWSSVSAPNTGPLTSVTAIARDLAWAHGGAELVRWNGATWSADTGIPATSQVAGRARDDAWAYTSGTPSRFWHWDGAAWNADVPPGPALAQIWVDPAGTVWGAGGYDRILRRDACGWSYTSGAIHHSEAITGMWASGQDVRMISAPYGGLTGVDACGLAPVSTLTNDTSNAIGGTALDDLWIVGAYGMIEHWDGVTASVPPQPLGAAVPTLHGVWASSPIDAWAVGELGRITHWDGKAWADVVSPTTNWLTAVWGVSATDVWAVGESGTILHWDGAAWKGEDGYTRAWLGSVWGVDDGVWAVGESGTILQRVRGTWVSLASGTTATLMEVRGRAMDDVWAVGEGGTVVRYQGATWQTIPTDSTATLTAIGLGDATWVGGAGALVMWRPISSD